MSRNSPGRASCAGDTASPARCCPRRDVPQPCPPPSRWPDGGPVAVVVPERHSYLYEALHGARSALRGGGHPHRTAHRAGRRGSRTAHRGTGFGGRRAGPAHRPALAQQGRGGDRLRLARAPAGARGRDGARPRRGGALHAVDTVCTDHWYGIHLAVEHLTGARPPAHRARGEGRQPDRPCPACGVRRDRRGPSGRWTSGRGAQFPGRGARTRWRRRREKAMDAPDAVAPSWVRRRPCCTVTWTRSCWCSRCARWGAGPGGLLGDRVRRRGRGTRQHPALGRAAAEGRGGPGGGGVAVCAGSAAVSRDGLGAGPARRLELLPTCRCAVRHGHRTPRKRRHPRPRRPLAQPPLRNERLTV